MQTDIDTMTAQAETLASGFDKTQFTCRELEDALIALTQTSAQIAHLQRLLGAAQAEAQFAAQMASDEQKAA